MNKLIDDDKMPFGKYKRERMDTVPASYLVWLQEQEWIKDRPGVKQYIEYNRNVIDKELGLDQYGVEK